MAAMKHSPLVLLALLALTGTAVAQDRPPADRVHDFHSLDRHTAQSTFGFALGYEIWDDNAFIDEGVGIEIAGHFVSTTGIGGYLVLPLSYIQLEDPLNILEEDSELALGNLELGGMFVSPVGADMDLIFHGGVALATADDDGAGGAQALASVPRPGDLVLRWPNTTWLRLGFSPMGRAGIFFWRVDLGLDVELDDDDGAGADISPVLHVSAGGGVDLGKADITAELVNVFDDTDDDNDDESSSMLALGARFGAGSTYPGIALMLPVGDQDIEALDFVLAFSLTARM